MNEYESFRMDVINRLADTLSNRDLQSVTEALDFVAGGYSFSKQENSMVVYDMTDNPMVKYYIASKRVEGLSEKTLDSYSVILNLFFRQIGKPPQNVTTNDIRMWLANYKMLNNISDSSLEVYREYISRFFDFAYGEKFITDNPCKNVRRIKTEYKRRKSLTSMQLNEMRRKITDKRTLAFVDFAVSTGCRVSEIINVKTSQIDFNSRSLTVVGKGKKERVVFLNDDAVLSIKDYLATRKDDCPYLFVGKRLKEGKAVPLKKEAAEKFMRELSEELNFDFRVTPHIMRHTNATMIINRGGDLGVLQQMLGHASPATTMRYADVSEEKMIATHKMVFN